MKPQDLWSMLVVCTNLNGMKSRLVVEDFEMILLIGMTDINKGGGYCGKKSIPT